MKYYVFISINHLYWNLRCYIVGNISPNLRIFSVKNFWHKIWPCGIFDKFQVWVWPQRSFSHFWPPRKILNSLFVGFSPNDCSNTWEGESLWSDYMIYRRMPSCKPKPSRSLSEGGLRLGWKPLLTKGPYIPGSFSLYHQSHREKTLPRFIEKKDVKWNQPALKQWKNRHILHCHQIEVVDGGVVTPYAFYIAAQVH